MPLRNELFAAASVDVSTILRNVYLDRINNLAIFSSDIPGGAVRRFAVEEITELLRLFTVNI
ncbi:MULTISPECIES: hypothetical protein [Candidatus Ichthyocystis]|uniref:hypothetical protein n=1 Tax=Candidatus Ichthyocystis TaxID=2929841 RepID=UPI000B819D7E|nr:MULTISPECIES: hypothetical protein [Ichthyocystis]